MTVRWVHTKRRVSWPAWSLALAVTWAALGSANVLLGAATGRPAPLCLFKHVTGCPCPTCGFTRGALALLHGHPIQAWLHNPFLFSLLSVGGLVVLAGALSGKTPRLTWTRREQRAAWIVLAVLFLANWLYVIRCVG